VSAALPARLPIVCLLARLNAPLLGGLPLTRFANAARMKSWITPYSVKGIQPYTKNSQVVEVGQVCPHAGAARAHLRSAGK